LKKAFTISSRNGSLEDGAAQWAGGRVIGILQPGKTAKHAGVGEVYFGRFHQTFSDIGMVGPQDNHLEGGLKDREPGLRCVHRDSEIARKVGETEQLAVPRRQRLEEALEGSQIPHLAQRPHVALKIRLNIVPLAQVPVSYRTPRAEAPPPFRTLRAAKPAGAATWLHGPPGIPLPAL
jgi:hypothetical protein